MAEATVQPPKLFLKCQGSVIKACIIAKPEFTIGRKVDNDLVIEDGAVSGRHARIVKIQAVYFIEDLGSTNGTYIDGNKIDRKQLRDADVVTIGKHKLLFMEDVEDVVKAVPQAGGFSDKTTFLRSGDHSSPSPTKRQMGVVKVVSGRTDRKQYKLNKQLTIIGSEPDASIRLTGFFAPKTAAMIGRRGDGYYVTVAAKKTGVQLNDLAVEGQADLKDGDVLEVAGVKMYFYLKDAA